MRQLAALALVLAPAVATAAPLTDDELRAAIAKAGFANPAIVTRGDLVIVTSGATPDPIDDLVGAGSPVRVLAVDPSGAPITELDTLDGPVTATVKPFLGNAKLYDVDLGYRGVAHSPSGYAARRRMIVRAGTLEKACAIDMGYDTQSAFKGSRRIQKVTVTKAKGTPLAFTVLTVKSGNMQGRPIRERTRVRYTLGDTGACAATK